MPPTGFGRSPLSRHFRTLRPAGLAVTAFEEPEPTEGSMAEGSQGPLLREVPFHCVAEARKPPAVNGAPSSGPWRRPRGSLVGRHTNFY